MLARLAALRSRFPLAALYVASTSLLVAGTAAQLVSFVILARFLGVEQFGQLMAITAATHLGTHLCGLGAGEGMVRRVARNREDYSALLGHSIILVLATAAVLIVGLTVGISLLVTISADAARNTAIILMFAVSNVLMFRVVLLAEQIFIAQWRIPQANAVNVGFAMAKALTALAACVGFGVTTLEGWVYWHFGVHAIAAVICIAAVVPFGPPKLGLLRDELRLGIHFSTPWFFLTLRNNIDLLVLTVVASPAVVGAYSVVKRVVETSQVTSSSLNRLLYPRLSRAGKEGCHATLAVVMSYMVPIVAVAAATSAALYAVAPWVPLLVGDGFAASVDGIQILCWTLIIFAVKGAAFDALGAADMHAIRATVYNTGCVLGAGLIGLGAYFFLVPGAFAAIYVTVTLIGVALWATLIALSRRHAAATAAPAAHALEPQETS